MPGDVYTDRRTRYKVSVEGKGVVPSQMDPAAGYDPRLPHDMAHFVVENELGLMGVFGQPEGTLILFASDRTKSNRAKGGDRILRTQGRRVV